MYAIFILLFIIELYKVSAEDVRCSLTFVIYNSGSMHNVIDQVKVDADSIFDTVVNSNFSQIEHFVLVTFEDSVTLRTATKDRGTFKEALASFKVDGGGDCPENSLTAIKLGLEKSGQASYMYIFTDASAKDYKMAPEIETLAQRKQIQLVFVLTDNCGRRDDEDYKVYETLAQATLGQVFYMDEYDIDKIIKYIKHSISSRENVITSKTFPPGDGHKFDVNVDGDTKELVIEVCGLKPTVNVTHSKGATMPSEYITNLTEVAIVKVSDVKPGVYNVDVGSKSETKVRVSGTSTIHFQHGFSLFKPTAITDTAQTPIPDKESYLSIKLVTEEKVELHSVQILDMNETVVLERPLHLEDESGQFYISEPLVPPNHMFRIAIKGYDRESNTFVTRLSLTPMKPQEAPIIAIEKAPEITIDGGARTEVNFGEPFLLKCKVSGYPEPAITWESDDPTTVLSHNATVVEIPYDFLSVLYIKNVTKNWKYTCKAVNKLKVDFKSIAVDVKRKKALEIVKVSNDTSIEYKKRSELYCQVNAFPPATILWYKDRWPLVTHANLALSSDNSTLVFRSMEPGDAGDYICEVTNEFGREVIPIRVSITGVERPKINKNTYEFVQLKHSSVDIQCNVIRGKPKPTFTWYYSEKTSPFAPFTELIHETTDNIHIDDIGMEHGGRYRCKVTNVMGQDIHDIDLIVEFPPTLTASVRERISALAGEVVTLPCPAHGEPPVNLEWSFNGEELTSGYTVLRDGSLRLKATLTGAGEYECEASNEHGHISIQTYLDVNVPVHIGTPRENTRTVIVGTNLELPCKAEGFPKPTIYWMFSSKDSGSPKNMKPSNSSGSLYIKTIQANQGGVYTCVASNDVSSQNISYTINVGVPPSITYTKKQYTAVVDDYVLQIPCNASGNPKPDIIWKHDGLDIGPPWHHVNDEGTLSVFDINEKSGGNYVCYASNKHGVSYEIFDAIVETCPMEGLPESSIWLEEGKNASISCNVPHLRSDRLRWFKDRRMISKGELTLNPVIQIDSGVYTCRVSFVSGAIHTNSTKIEVGSKPQFIINDPTDIAFEMGKFVSLSCDASGKPTPETWWLHDDKPLSVTTATHEVEMVSSRAKGRYKCIVHNMFDTIQKEYRILTYECNLDIKKDFYGNQPIMTRYKALSGQIRIPGGGKINLACPNYRNQFQKIAAREITVECVNEKLFSYGGNRYQFSDLKCEQRAYIIERKTNLRCTHGNSEMKSIGFYVRNTFKEVYQVCLDLDTKNSIFTKQTIEPNHADVVPEYDIASQDEALKKLYDCDYQKVQISRALGRDFHSWDECCFAKRQLVNARDVAPGLEQVATYSRLNEAPQWSTCHSENWLEVEDRIRSLAKNFSRPLLVWTGTANRLQMFGKSVAITSYYNTTVEVPEYFWKVVQDPETLSSLAIVHVNVPDLTLEEASRHLICRNICPEVDWMRWHWWSTFKRGYTYCCRLKQFKDAFNLHEVFEPWDRVLRLDVYVFT